MASSRLLCALLLGIWASCAGALLSSYCTSGLLSDDGSVCCDAGCGQCGGTGCGSLPGGSSKCCTKNIKSSGVACAKESDVACNVPTSPGPSPSPTPGKHLGPDATWSLQAWSEGKDPTAGASMVDVDLFDQHDQISGLKKAGHVVICYYSAGTSESWRPDVEGDKKSWQEVIVGKMKDWDEAWLDITQLSKVSKLMEKRIDLAQKYGCDGVEPDNTDCYDNDDCYKKITPSISQDQAKEYQMKYNQWTANYVHSKGMLVALKNTGDLVPKLHQMYDFAIVEQCLDYDECGKYADFHSDNKAIFGIEYKTLGSSDCSKAKKDHVQMKYCAGHKSQECQSKANIHDCWKSDSADLSVIV